MGIILKNNGEAVVEEPRTTAQGVQTQTAQQTAQVQSPAAADSGNSETTGQSTKPASTAAQTQSGTSVPEKVTAGLDYESIQQGLNTQYVGKWDEQIADVYNKIVHRQPFEYSTEDDMLYKMYEQKYTQQGKQAMRDSMGQAAALTGGYGSSYGQAVGQQNYDAYMQELNNLIPELFDRAYQQYAAEGDRLTQQYGLLTDMDSRDYNRFTTQYGMNVDAYNRLMNEAAVLGAAGDFSKYKEIFGEDSANRMSQLFNAQTLMPLWQNGVMDAEMYKSLTGSYPVGYVAPGSGGGSGSGRAASDILREQEWEIYNSIANNPEATEADRTAAYNITLENIGRYNF